MKTLLIALVMCGVSWTLLSEARADGCYLCQGGGYVQYTGDDTFEKRKKAEQQFGCKVGGTTSSCSNPQGTVSWYRVLPELLALNFPK